MKKIIRTWKKIIESWTQKQNIIQKEFAENTGNKKEISNFVCYHLKTKKYGQ